MNYTTLSPAERLVVAADFRPEPNLGKRREWVRGQVLELANELKGLGVYLKLNSILRACGYDLPMRIYEVFGLKVFWDLKLFETKGTLSADALLLAEFVPEILTVSCSSSVSSLKALKECLPHTEVLGVTVPTNFDAQDVSELYACTIVEAVARAAEIARRAKLDGLVCAPAEIRSLRFKFRPPATLNAANVRYKGVNIEDDDQNPGRSMPPGDVIKLGATRIIVGRPILSAPNRREEAKRIIEEIRVASVSSVMSV